MLFVLQELFYCHGIRKLSISDNEITKIPPAIASLINLEELDLSKNGRWTVKIHMSCRPVLTITIDKLRKCKTILGSYIFYTNKVYGM